MKYNIFGYLIGEGFGNVFKNKKSTGASLMIMCATMIIFGIFLMLGENINHFVDEIKAEQGFQVFLTTDATDEEIQEVGEKIRALNGISTIEKKSKQDAINTLKEGFGEKADLLDELNSEVFSVSYVVTLTDLSLSKDIQNEILGFENIKRITSNDPTVTTLLNVAKAIKLTVHSRRKEISIMKYVGATNNFIRWPFIVEGIIIGIIASSISIVIVGGAYSLIAQQAVNVDFMKIMNMSLVSFKDMISSIIVVYVLLGIGIGATGSVISMRKYLKV